jgi:hypothetical protein
MRHHEAAVKRETILQKLMSRETKKDVILITTKNIKILKQERKRLMRLMKF